MSVVALIDHSRHAAGVCHHAVWAAARLGVPVEVVHAIEWRSHPVPSDRSGQLGIDTPDELLHEMAALDEEGNRLAREAGRLLLEEAARRIRAAGVTQVHQRLVHGDLFDYLRDHERDTSLIVMGRYGESGGHLRHPGRILERIVRASHRPILVCVESWQPIERFLFAYDGGRSAGAAIAWLVDTQFLNDANGHVLQVGEGNDRERERLSDATWHLRSAGLRVTDETVPGSVEEVIARAVERLDANLLVMGAYGHSRIRSFMVGSTTAELLQTVSVSMLVFH
jgi:nucleotide-binding universal stress UspA family protein